MKKFLRPSAGIMNVITVIILLQPPVGESREVAHNEMDSRQNSQIKGTLMDHVNFSAGFDPTNDLLINTMLS